MAYIIKGRPFEYKGAIDVRNCCNSVEVIQKSNLNWTVDKCELTAKIPTRNIDIDGIANTEELIYGDYLYSRLTNEYAVYRTDNGMPLGLVKGRYTPVQNIDAFNFFDNAIGKNKAIWQTAGYFGNGERIFVSAKLPNTITVKGDPIDNYLVFTNSHDGSSGVKILFTPIRIVCKNTLNAAINNATNYVSFKHTKNVHDNIDIADRILGICNIKTSFIKEQYERLADIKLTDDEAEKQFAKLILTEEEIQNVINTGHTIKQIILADKNAGADANISTKKLNTLYKINEYYHAGIGQKEILGTAWGAYNAVTGYYSNIDNINGIKRMDSLLFGDRARKIENAGNLLLAA